MYATSLAIIKSSGSGIKRSEAIAIAIQMREKLYYYYYYYYYYYSKGTFYWTEMEIFA